MYAAINELGKVWPEWQIKKQLGKGTFGVVYEAVRYDHNLESRAAIKVISIPNDISEVNSLRSEGLGEDATRTYLQGIVDDFVSEIRVMESFKGLQNIVSVEDYKVAEKTDELGWNIFIRMELLMPFNELICDRRLSESEVIKLGCDICTALEVCNKRNIIHRDVKPENIMINAFGDYKLGDFGVARQLEHVTFGLSQKGTYNYIAPEVVHSDRYDARVDIYSLGIVLYRLLNKNRLPFLDTDKQLLNPYERKHAIDRRLRGEMLPDPCEASPKMAEIVLKACAYDPNKRFSSATEMKKALMRAGGGYEFAIAPGTLPAVGSQNTIDKENAKTESDAETMASAKRSEPEQVSPDDEQTAPMQKAESPIQPEEKPKATEEERHDEALDATVLARKPEQSDNQTVMVNHAEPPKKQTPQEEPKETDGTELVRKAPVKRVRVYGNLEPTAPVNDTTVSDADNAPEESISKKKSHAWLKVVVPLLICLIVGSTVLVWWGLGINEIVVDKLPNQTSYFTNGILDTTGCEIAVINNFGFKKTIDSGFECLPTELSTAGNQKVTVTYSGKITSFNVNVNKVEVSSISIKTNPTKTSYYVGDTLNTSGLTLNVKYSNGETKTVVSGFTCSPIKFLNVGTQKITVTYSGKITSFYVTAKSVYVSSISIKTNPTKMSYYVGETLNTSGLTLNVKYSNGETKTVVSGFTCLPIKFLNAGTQKITVTYSGKTTSFYVTAKSVYVSSISIKTNPTKTSYYVGETLNTSGLTLNVKYSNGETKTVSSGFTCLPIKFSSAGTQKITVTYSGKTTSFNVTVKSVNVSSISIKTSPAKTKYYTTEHLDTSGLTLTVKHSDGRTETVSNGFTCSPEWLWLTGKQKITVTYKGKTTSFNVSAEAKKENMAATDGSYCIFEYDASGNRVKQTWYTAEGIVEWINDAYDSHGNYTRTTYYNPDGTVDYITILKYEYYSNGRIKKVTIYRRNEWYYTNEYDTDGALQKQTWYNSKGIVEWVLDKFDSSGRHTRTTYYNPDGTVDRVEYINYQ